MSSLQEYYARRGYPGSRWHIGPEHPQLEDYAIRLLSGQPRARVLEVGYQAGGFAVPVILAMRDRTDFAYVGVDSMAYGNAVEGRVIAGYLESRGVSASYEFLIGDAGEVLAKKLTGPFDLVLLDHDKALYQRELRTLLRRGLVSPDGCVLIHDVLGKARQTWRDCILLVRAYGYTAKIVEEIPEGLAVVRRQPGTHRITLGQRIDLGWVYARICGRWARAVVRRWRRRIRGDRVTLRAGRTR